MKKALITGITGQDGAYLADFLLKKGYKVYGTYRRLSTPNFWRLQYLNIFDKVELLPMDMLDSYSMIEVLKLAQPNELYNLAAQSFVGASFEQAISSTEVTGLGVIRLLEAIRLVSPDTKLYQASSSEMYGDNNYELQDELTELAPSSPYAAAKVLGYNTVKIYRKGYQLFASNGILFNHESPLRGLEFVTRKISNAVAKLKLGLIDKLELGNIYSFRDWGYAPEYVEAMWLVLQKEIPDDYVIATNSTHSVKDFLNLAFECVDLNWNDYVLEKDEFKRPLEVNYLKGDFGKAEKYLGWKPKTEFKELVKIMVESDLKRWKDWQQGIHFPWDAWNYPSEKKLLSRKIQLDH